MMRKLTSRLLFGSTIGTITGLFLAPHSGKETRTNIRNSTTDFIYSVQDTHEKIINVQKAIGEIKEVSKTTIPILTKELTRDIERYHFQMEPRIQRATQQVKKIQSEYLNVEK
ncbi:YtxH domain-containing protein [Melissococcus plutonius]|uniref:YtxH domain-containing protein n=2 Tax=Melissococcus plutonius TaxID=33970 RepID=UPI0021E52CA3|nr:YtxH domain-containing protein [Melissococcus plutonius]